VNFPIKKCCALLLALFAFAQNCFAADETRFRAGVTAYEAGQYDLAAQVFSDALAEKITPGTLLNLGLAEWRGGHTGEAVVAWEQAAWLDPFNRDAQNNLLFAQETAQLSPVELTWFEQASTWLPANCWTLIAGGSLWLAVALVTVPGFLRRRKAGWHQTVAALALGIFLLSLAPVAGIVTRSQIGIVTEKNTSLRLTPTQLAETVASLPPGEPVRALRQHGDYFFVHTQTGDGWVGHGEIKWLCPTRVHSPP
jgi:tetratricopeptide (TPR) repeat protein